MNELRKSIHQHKELKSKLKSYHKHHHYHETEKPDIPEGLYEKCPNCEKTIHSKENVKNDFVCSHCDYHFRMRAIDRIHHVVDHGSFIEKGIGYISLNPLFQHGYEEKLLENKKRTHLDEAYVYGYAKIYGKPCVVGVMDSFFLMGSMGSVVGEKITKSFEYAIYKKLPIIIFTASGGARMQEGIFSLMQMAKTSAAVAKHSKTGLLYISVLTHPTTGGVTASFATLSDIILAEPGALIGFAGPRVIEQTIKQKLPEGFQRSEFLKEHGFIDMVIHRKMMKTTLSKLLNLHRGT